MARFTQLVEPDTNARFDVSILYYIRTMQFTQPVELDSDARFDAGISDVGLMKSEMMVRVNYALEGSGTKILFGECGLPCSLLQW